MAGKKRTLKDAAEAMRRFAMLYPEAEEGTSCNKAAFRARKKAYLYLGTKEDSMNVMLKLRDSKAEAEKLAAKQPHSYSINQQGWVTARFGPEEPPPGDLFERWIDESYRLFVPKKLLALLPESGPPGR